MAGGPNRDENRETHSVQETGFNPARLSDAIGLAQAHQTSG
jgi:hypothetical protein